MSSSTTPICDFGAPIVDFALPGTDGKTYQLSDIKGEKGTLVMFICNHCPFVRGVIGRIVEDTKVLQAAGVGVVAISSNDPSDYAQDAPGKMVDFAAAHQFTFPYLFDGTQDVAKAYGAICTPDFFGYSAAGELQYRGRLDASRTQPIPNARRELVEAMQQIIKTGKGPAEQIPSIGCTIKWREEMAT